MEDIGWASLQIIPSLKGFEGKLSSATGPGLSKVGTSGGEKFGGSFASKASSSIRSKFSETAKFIVAPLAAAFAVEGIGRLVGESISAASDLNESQNKVQQVFKSSANEVFDFTAKAATALGQSDLEARNAAAGFGIFGRAAGLNDAKTAKFSIRLDKLAGDLASFHNTSPEQAIEAIGGALRGETEPIRAYGILLNQASIQAEALRLGLLKPVKDQAKIHSYQLAILTDQKAYNDAVEKSGKGSLDAFAAHVKLESAQSLLEKAVKGSLPPLTQQQQVLAAQSLILKQSAVAQGDFSRTSGGLANQQRILAASWENAKTKLGRGLLPVVNDFVHFLNREAIPVVTDFSDWFGKKGAPGVQEFVDNAKPLAHSILPAIGTGFKDIGGFLKDAAPKAKSVIDAFNSLPDWAQKTIVLGAGAGVLAKKTGALSFGKAALTGGGSSGGLLGLVSQGKPVPVFVTNPGGLGGGTGIGGSGNKGGPLAAIPLIGTAIAAGFASKQFADNERAREQQRFGTNDLIDIAKIKLERELNAQGLKPGGSTAIKVGDLTIQLPGEPAKLGIKALTDHSDALKQHLGQASTALDLVSRHGSQTFGGLSNKIQGTSTRTDILDHKLRGLPKSLRTELALDDREARRRLAAFRQEAQRSLALELAPGPHMGRPGDSSLDGVRR